MALYFYTAASLPSLVFEEEPYYSTDDVLELCSRELKSRDQDAVKEASDYFAGGESAPFLSKSLTRFDTWERSVRAILSRLRAQKLGWEYEAPEISDESGADRVARDAISQSSPFEAEMIIQRARWNRLSEIGVNHFFDIDFLVVYLLMLGVSERNSVMETERGAERFNEIYSGMVQTLKS